MTSPSETTLADLARRIAPNLRIVSESQPAPVLREHNVVAVARDPEVARRAVLALESLEHADNRLGTIVMGSGEQSVAADDGQGKVDPEGVGRQIVPRVLLGALGGAVIGAVVVGIAALVFGAEGWTVAGAAAAGAMMFAVFGAIWFTFAGLGGSDAYRQTFVDDAVRELTIVSVHTDDIAAAASVRERLAGDSDLRVLEVDRNGQVSADSAPTSSTQ